MKAALILGTQLLENHPALTDTSVDIIIMIEAKDVSAKLPYHRHKLILLFSAMRHFKAQLTRDGHKVIYRTLSDTPSFSDALTEIIKKNKVSELVWMVSSDTPTNKRLELLCDSLSVTTSHYDNGLFITSDSELRTWFKDHPRSLMEVFYRWQRQRTGILCEGTLPVGGRWNFDADNRKPLPKQSIHIPSIELPAVDKQTQEVIDMVNTAFPDNPGNGADFWLPVTHKDAKKRLESFISERFENFGTYEDAMKNGEPFLFHSVLSPLLNCGLLSVNEVIEAALNAYEKDNIPLHSVEGFIRQIIGWREYMYGMYLTQQDLKDANYFGFTKQLEDWWYNDEALSQDLPPPVLGALQTVLKYGYNHHIERLMILGNWFLINEYDPRSVYRWFSTMYVDAYEWVMVPNVMGMSQYADGGKTATKPYISGGNYLQKMGQWWPSAAAAQKSIYTELYWQFLENNYELLKKNYRMSLVLKQVQARRAKTK